jgi:hypothetical protein
VHDADPFDRVAGPLVDTFFLGGKLDRRQIVAQQVDVPDLRPRREADLFRPVIDQAASVDPLVAGLAIACSMIGTTLAAKVLLANDRPAVPHLGEPDHHRARPATTVAHGAVLAVRAL